MRQRFVLLILFFINAQVFAQENLCKNVKYSAHHNGDQIFILAKGVNPTSGWVVKFKRLPLKIFPPQHQLWCIPPEGMVLQVLTEYQVKVSFKSRQPLPQVIVHDADGKHRVPVMQAPEPPAIRPYERAGDKTT